LKTYARQNHIVSQEEFDGAAATKHLVIRTIKMRQKFLQPFLLAVSVNTEPTIGQ
jgi:hypothetical protein